MCKGGKALLHMVGCISGLAALWHDGHTLSVHRMTTDVPLHKSVVRSKTAVYHSMVYPGDAVHGELLRQRKMRLVVFCHYKQAAGVLVNAVHDAGTHFAVDAGEPARAVVQQCVHQCAVRVSRRRVDHHSLGLIDNQQRAVFVNDIQRDILRNDFHRLGVRQRNTQRISLCKARTFGDGTSVAQYTALCQKLLCEASRQFRERRCQRGIDAAARIFGTGGIFKRFHPSRPSAPFWRSAPDAARR